MSASEDYHEQWTQYERVERSSEPCILERIEQYAGGCHHGDGESDVDPDKVSRLFSVLDPPGYSSERQSKPQQ